MFNSSSPHHNNHHNNPNHHIPGVSSFASITSNSEHDADGDAEVRALAAKLAPALREADALFSRVPEEFQDLRHAHSHSGGGGSSDMDDDYDDDDDLDEEEAALMQSEELLRQELATASDFSNLFANMTTTTTTNSASRSPFSFHFSSEQHHSSSPFDAAANTPTSVFWKFRGGNHNNQTISTSIVEADMDPDEASPATSEPVLASEKGVVSPLHLAVAAAAAAAAANPNADADDEETKESDDTNRNPTTVPSSNPEHLVANTTFIDTPLTPRRFASSKQMSQGTSTPTQAGSDVNPIAPSTPSSLLLPQNVQYSESVLTYNAVEQYTQQQHFEYLDMHVEEKGGWYSVDLTKHLVPDLHTKMSKELYQKCGPGLKEYCLAIPEGKLKHLFIGVPDGGVGSAAAAAPGAPHKKNTTTTRTAHPTGSDVPSSDSGKDSAGGGATISTSPSKDANHQNHHLHLPTLPVRTLMVRIRPDVLCGAVMGAVQCAVQSLGGGGEGTDGGSGGGSSSAGKTWIRKRQGGHLQAVVSGTAVAASAVAAAGGGVAGATTTYRYGYQRQNNTSEYDDNGKERNVGESSTSKHGERNSEPAAVWYPPYSVDIQLATCKSHDCERVLLIRIYHVSPEEEKQLDEDYKNSSPSDGGIGSAVSADGNNNNSGSNSYSDAMDKPISPNSSLHLREACALIQRIEESHCSTSKSSSKRMRPILSPGRSMTRQAMQASVTQHFLINYRACPSVKEGSITLPSLNSNDWPVIQHSWRLVQSIWDELENRDLTFTSLALAAQFGAFPSLPTLDVHYCSQIRRLSREGMIMQLLKSASELEDYAREAEYACANMISLLQPTFEMYKVRPPELPKTDPLTSYPLNFTAPQQACPPWGQKVMQALNEIQAWTSEANANPGSAAPSFDFGPLSLDDASYSLKIAIDSVALVLKAFQDQDDEEKGARLARKNVQVMDRLAKMQEHQRKSIQSLRTAYLRSNKAYKASEDFLAKSKKKDQVPLLKWSIVVGGSTGTCIVTADYIVFVTQLIPVIGGSTTKLWRLQDVEFSVTEGSASLLNPLPTIISVRQGGKEVYSFRPSMGGSRLVGFLDIVKTTTANDPPPED